MYSIPFILVKENENTEVMRSQCSEFETGFDSLCFPARFDATSEHRLIVTC